MKFPISEKSGKSYDDMPNCQGLQRRQAISGCPQSAVCSSVLWNLVVEEVDDIDGQFAR